MAKKYAKKLSFWPLKFEQVIRIIVNTKPPRKYENEIQRDMQIILLRKKGIEPKKIASQLKVPIKDVKEVISNYPWYKR